MTKNDFHSAELTSEGVKASLTNESEGNLIKVRNEAEATKTKILLEADAQAQAIRLLAMAQAEALAQIAQQLQAKRPTAIGSDYQFDIPIHMPFMLQWNSRKNIIELIPRTIKKQRKTWQQNPNAFHMVLSPGGINSL